jgi:hypothetical protein
LYDNHFAELKDAELLNERLSLVATAEPYVGKYFSQDYVRRKILRQTDQEIIEENKMITKEIEDGTIPDPAMMSVDPQTGQPIPTEGGGPASMDLGQPMMEPDLRDQEKSVEVPEGGEI